MQPKKLTAMFIYPIPGVRGISVQEAEVTPFGLKHNREFIIVDDNEKIVSPGRAPKMNELTVKFDKEFMNVSYPGAPQLYVRHSPRPNGANIPIDICGKLGYGTVREKYTAAWFSERLGLSCHLIQCDFSNIRSRNGADGPAVVLIPQENGSGTPVEMNQFQPNLVVAGCTSPFAVDSWEFVRINETRFVGVRDGLARPLSSGKKLKVSCVGTIRVGNQVHAS